MKLILSYILKNKKETHPYKGTSLHPCYHPSFTPKRDTLLMHQSMHVPVNAGIAAELTLVQPASRRWLSAMTRTLVFSCPNSLFDRARSVLFLVIECKSYSDCHIQSSMIMKFSPILTPILFICNTHFLTHIALHINSLKL